MTGRSAVSGSGRRFSSFATSMSQAMRLKVDRGCRAAPPSP